MKKKPIALLITPVLPEAGGSGRALRAWDWLKTLNYDYRVHVLVVGSNETCHAPPDDYPADDVCYLDNSTLLAMHRYYRVLGLAFPFLAWLSNRFVTDWQHWEPSGATGSKIRTFNAAIGGEPVSRIVTFRLYLYDIGKAFTDEFSATPYDLDVDDMESRTRFSIALCLARMGFYRKALISFSTAIQYALVERKLAGRFEHVFLSAQEDAEFLPSRLRSRIAIRSNRIEVPYYFAKKTLDRELGLIFVGTLNYPPNEESVRYLVNKVAPLLERRLSKPWCLRVVGRHASSALRTLSETHRNIHLIDDAENLTDLYAQTDIVLVPLFAGGGTKLKTIEGFAHHCAVISTEQGVRGLEARIDEDYLAAQTANDFANAIVSLATNPQRMECIARAGHALYMKKYAIIEPLGH